jgi:quercetin dioxygenase-like cupin family protein
MERKRFVSNILAFAFIPATFKIQNQSDYKYGNKGFKIDSGESRIYGHIKLKGVNSNILDLKVSGKDTNGELAIFEQTSISQGRGTPLHIHPYQDEVFYVIEGEYYLRIGTEKVRLGPGDSIFMARDVPHAWTQVSMKGKMIIVFQPAGKMEEFFITLAGLEKEPSADELARIFLENEMHVVGPPLKIE